ncbi:hypothetical protein F5Y15DRAFT_414940 [Xylariaceae sp. FL0016]|nr:hypothetical protein F5Y15DRAFT_414940 [Xylariaceae sp. FL0016]
MAEGYEWKGKAPDRIDMRLRVVAENEASRTMMNAGFAPWFAWNLAYETTLRSQLDALSSTENQYLASELAKLPPSKDVTQLSRHLFASSSRAVKRQRTLGFTPSLSVITPDSAAVTPSPTASSSLIPGSGPTATGVAPSRASSVPPVSPPPEFPPFLSAVEAGTGILPPLGSTSDSAAFTQSLGELEPKLYRNCWPPAHNLPAVFPPDLCQMITKIGYSAAVTLKYADPRKCLLELWIDSQHVLLVARNLFDVRVHEVSGKRYMMYPNGSEAEIIDRIVLRRATYASLGKVFGAQLQDACRKHALFAIEVYQGENVTRCVSMTIYANTSHGSRICLLGELDSLYPIGNALYDLNTPAVFTADHEPAAAAAAGRESSPTVPHQDSASANSRLPDVSPGQV